MEQSFRVVLVIFVLTKFVLLRLAPLRLASLRLAPLRPVWLRLASNRSAPLSLAPLRFISLTLAPLRSGLISGCCFLHAFQTSLPCLSRSRCSWFGMYPLLLSFLFIIAFDE